MIRGHGGNIYETAKLAGCSPLEIIDMSSNVNPLGPPEDLEDHLIKNLKVIRALPEVDSKTIIAKFAKRYLVSHDSVLSGNGTTQFIYFIPKVLDSVKALIIGPTYSDYADACIMNRVEYDYLLSEKSNGFLPDMNLIEKFVSGYDTVFLCNPNNPTGSLIRFEELADLCKRHGDTFFVIDESYLPFVKNSSKISMVNADLSNVIVLNSMSKIFDIPGLRIGFLISCKKTIEKFKFFSMPWSVNSLAQAAVSYLMTNKDSTEKFMDNTIRFVEKEKQLFLKTMDRQSNVRFFPSTTCFLLAELYEDFDAESVCEKLLKQRILIRNCANFKGLSNRFIRISLKAHENNLLLANSLLEL